MSSGAKLGKGTLFKVGDGASPEAFTTIGEVKSISGGPGGVADEIDVTNHDSVGRYEEIILGIIRTPTISLVCNYLGSNTQQNALKTAMDAETLLNFKIVYQSLTTPKTHSFAGRIKKWEITPPVNGAIDLSVDIKQTGADTGPA